MKRGVFLLLILLLFLVGCTQPVCNTPYILVGTECCLDENANAICDSDETQKEVTVGFEVIEPPGVEEPEIIEEPEVVEEKEYKIDFEITAITTVYFYGLKTFEVEDLSFILKNQGDELDNLRFDVEVYQEGSLVGSAIKKDLFDEEVVVKENERIIGRQEIAFDTAPDIVGSDNYPLKIKFSLYQEDELLFTENKSYMILWRTGNINEVFPELEPRSIDINFVENHWVLYPPYRFKFSSIPQRLSFDGNIEFSSTIKDGIYTFTIENVGDESIEGEFYIDYYCHNTIGPDSFSYMIHDALSYFQEFYTTDSGAKFLDPIPTVIGPNSKVIKDGLDLGCDENVLLLRDKDRYLVRMYQRN